jgi:hypothetical protein
MMVLFAALLLQATTESTLPVVTFSISTELEPAVMPYFDCLRARTSEKLTFPITDPAIMDIARDAAVGECRDVRAAATANANAALRAQGLEAGARRQKIEALLHSIEAAFGGDLIRVVVARGRAAAAAKAKGQADSEPAESSPPQD